MLPNSYVVLKVEKNLMCFIAEKVKLLLPLDDLFEIDIKNLSQSASELLQFLRLAFM